MMKTTPSGNSRLGLLLCFAGLLCLFAPISRAADDNASDAGDPPTRVARISFIDGTVSLQPGGEGDWGAAQRNRPMTVGDKIWSDQNSRAELQTGVVSIHLGSMTALSFLNLDQNIMQVRLPEGSINFRVKEMREGDTFEVDTPNLAFIVKQAGAFRIDVNENGDNTGITVIRGAGQVTANGQTYDIQAGQRGVFNGTDENVQSNIAQAPAADQLDQWANDRDLREQNSVSSRYVPPDTAGADDLDNNGTWSEEPEVGHVWYPNDVGPDWAPYSNGYWSSIGPWGWTWVGYEPWGFAPYHYGRWGFWGGRWGWCPGPIGYPAVYGPAFVGFLGGGFGFGFGVGFGVGWFPLGWGEPFHPWYHGGFGYVERINVRNTYIRNVNVVHDTHFNNYAFAHNTRAVTATSRAGFASGQAVNRGAAHITEASLRGAEVTHNLNGVTPSRTSSFGASNLRGNVARPSSTIQNRNVMARTTPGSAAGNAHVQTMNTSRLSAGRFGSASANGNAGINRNNGNVSANNTRAWNAQGNTTDRGRAPQGFGSEARPGNSTTSAGTTRGDRPPWAGSGNANNNARGGSSVNSNNTRGGGSVYSNNTRSYNPPQRNNAPTYNGSRSYSPPPQSRTYSAPSRSYGSAPSNHGGGGGAPAPRGGGGGSAPHGGGGGGASHGGGGGGRPHR